VMKTLEDKAQELIKTDYNKYVVRVLNHGLNQLRGTDNEVR